MLVFRIRTINKVNRLCVANAPQIVLELYGQTLNIIQ